MCEETVMERPQKDGKLKCWPTLLTEKKKKTMTCRNHLDGHDLPSNKHQAHLPDHNNRTFLIPKCASSSQAPATV